MPQVEQVKSSKHKGAVASFVVGLVLIGVVIASGMYAYWLFVPTVSSVVVKAKNDLTNSQYAQAETLLKQALPRTQFVYKGDRESVLITLGATEFDMGKYQDSVNYYQQANLLNPGQESTLFELETAAQDAQDNSAELSADKQLLPIVQAQDIGPTRQADINDIQNRIAELEK